MILWVYWLFSGCAWGAGIAAVTWRLNWSGASKMAKWGLSVRCSAGPVNQNVLPRASPGMASGFQEWVSQERAFSGNPVVSAKLLMTEFQKLMPCHFLLILFKGRRLHKGMNSSRYGLLRERGANCRWAIILINSHTVFCSYMFSSFTCIINCLRTSIMP